MSTYQTRKGSLLEASRANTNHSTILNTTDVSLNSTNLESYKKALHSIVRRLNKTPSSSSKTTIKKLEYKMNQTQQPLYNNLLASSQSSKKYYMSPTSATKNQSIANRSQSNERSPYKGAKEGERSMQESYMRKESLTSNFMNSVSINKMDKQENTTTEDTYDEKLAKGDSIFVQDNGLNCTLLHDVNLNKVETEGDQRLRELVHKYQLRDSAYRQELNQMKKAHEAMRLQLFELEKEVDKANKNRDLEKRYLSKLEEENKQLKERLQQEAIEKKSLTGMLSETKENQYLKMIEDLKAQVSNLTSEKKLIEHLLKNSLMQKETPPVAPVPIASKENAKDDRKISTGILNTLESSSLAINSCKYANVKERVKTAPYTKKPAVAESFNDENDYSMHGHYQTLSSSFAAVPLKFDKDASLKEIKQPQQQQTNLSFNFGKPGFFLDTNNTQVDEVGESMDEGDEAFPNKVFHPKLNQKSLKERINMSQFKLDLTRISKSRKAD